MCWKCSKQKSPPKNPLIQMTMPQQKKFSYKASIPAAGQKQADIKMASLMRIASKLNAGQLEAIAKVVQNDPAKIEMALNFIGYKG